MLSKRKKESVLMCIVFTIVCAISVTSMAATEITVAGSSTIRPIIEKAAKIFQEENSGIKFVVGGGGSSHGVKSTANNEVVIGMASRSLKSTESKKWPDLVPVTIGRDGIAVIINGKNPVKKITKQQIQDIFIGKITNWKEVGGGDAKITLIGKEEGRSTLDLFLKYFDLEGKEVGEGKSAVMFHRVKPKEVKDPVTGKVTKHETPFSTVSAKLIGPNREAIAAVSIKKNTIAYVSVGTAQEIAAKGNRIKLLELDGVAATVSNVANESYPLRRPLNVVTNGAASGVAAEFIGFLMGPKGQKIVSDFEFVPVLTQIAKAN